MTKLRVHNLSMSLDGCFEGPGGELDWHSVENDGSSLPGWPSRGL